MESYGEIGRVPVNLTIIKQQLGVISNLRKAQGILQNAMTALGQSRENLVKNANAAMEAGGISDKQCPLCGAPYSDRDELDSKIKEETELLSDISDDSVIIIQDIRNQIYNKTRWRHNAFKLLWLYWI